MSKLITISVSLMLCMVVTYGCKTNESYSDAKTYAQAVSLFNAKDYPKAITLFSELANRKNPSAQGYLGLIYFYGLGVKQDFQEAQYWYERSAKQGASPSMIALADMHRYGFGIEKNCEQALYWYKKAVDEGDTMAMHTLSYLYKSGTCVSKNTKKANQYILSASTVDDEYGILCKALIHYEGIGVTKNYDYAKPLFERLSNEYNNKLSFLYLYYIYHYGLGVDKNISKSFELLKKASDLGLAIADYELAAQYFNGKYVDQNYKKVFHYAMKSVKRTPDSAYLLGVLYEQGSGVPVDLIEAKKWYRKATNMGSEKAQKRLSTLQ